MLRAVAHLVIRIASLPPVDALPCRRPTITRCAPLPDLRPGAVGGPSRSIAERASRGTAAGSQLRRRGRVRVLVPPEARVRAQLVCGASSLAHVLIGDRHGARLVERPARGPAITRCARCSISGRRCASAGSADRAPRGTAHRIAGARARGTSSKLSSVRPLRCGCGCGSCADQLARTRPDRDGRGARQSSVRSVGRRSRGVRGCCPAVRRSVGWAQGRRTGRHTGRRPSRGRRRGRAARASVLPACSPAPAGSSPRVRGRRGEPGPPAHVLIRNGAATARSSVRSVARDREVCSTARDAREPLAGAPPSRTAAAAGQQEGRTPDGGPASSCR